MCCNACDTVYSQPSKFVNLHVHSCYSLLDGMGKIEDIVKKVKKEGQHAFAITEHGNVFSAVKAYKLAKQNSLKHIYGIEFYITDNRFEKNNNKKYNHLTVLAKNEQGRLNINKLSTLGYLEGFYYKPRIDHDLLKRHKEGLIVLSGCMLSEFQQALAGGKIGDNFVDITEQNIENAKNVARYYRDIFGEDYYLEIQSHSDIRQQKLNRAIVDIAKDLGIKYVVTADSHYVDKEDFELHSIFIQIGQNREAGETYLDTQVQTEKEARELLGLSLTKEEVEEAIKNTMIIAEKCNTHIPLSEPIIPHVDIPNEFKSEAEYLKHLCIEGWKRRKIHEKPNVQEYKERLYFEYDAVTKMGFEGYYLLVESYANSVKRRGIARGSGGGSLIAYLLNITDIDPVKYGLYFERFIDVGALELLENGTITRKELKIPDIDLDFGKEDREKVIQSIIKKYGEDKFVALGQFGVIWDKTAIKDIGRVLGVPFSTLNEITKELENDTIEDALSSGKLKKYEEQFPKLFNYAKKITGIPKSFGIHPCGKAVTIDNVTNYTAIAVNDGTIVLQGDMHDAEDLGIVKIDTLGLRTIDVIYDTLEMIGKDYDYISPETLNFSDEKVLKVFKDGNTEGIFQFESDGMKNTLRKINPTGLDDLGVANALYRPGSMKFIDDYVKRKNGEEDVIYLHEDLKPILEVTYGIIVFQEQLIEIGRLAKMKNPDLLRKATGKKDAKLLEMVKPELFEGLTNRGWTKQQVEELWNIMLDFAKYSFNKSHAYAYAMIAYITAFLKAYHPFEFMCALFNSYINNNSQDKYERIEKINNEAKRLGINIQMPTFKEFKNKCFINKDKKLIYGLQLIKSIGKQVGTDLEKIQDNNYNNFVDLLVDIVENTSINRSQLNTLIRLNFFNTFGNSKKLELITEKFNEKYKKSYKETTKIKRIEEVKEFANQLEDVDDYTINEKVIFEMDVLGFAQTTDSNYSKAHVIITDINTKYTPTLSLYVVNNGKQVTVKVNKNLFYDHEGNPLLLKGDLIKVKNIQQKPKQVLVDGKWKETDIMQYWMTSWELIEKFDEKSKK